MEPVTALIVAVAFFLGAILATVLKPKDKSKQRFVLLDYQNYNETSWVKSGQPGIPSCRFTIADMDKNKVYRRFCYGEQYTMEQMKALTTSGIAHKMGDEGV